eukprot:TRINITY_DN40044_c0_g1_i1.p1 TRINITY_DN40044_c0_g1~~TRINITY_DN40044_c0_g1_i1.p1  ORF type:complete len:350 (+),score=46.61 TRINITY_DN40044_c0_g1_i1:118-1050(+)
MEISTAPEQGRSATGLRLLSFLAVATLFFATLVLMSSTPRQDAKLRGSAPEILQGVMSKEEIHTKTMDCERVIAPSAAMEISSIRLVKGCASGASGVCSTVGRSYSRLAEHWALELQTRMGDRLRTELIPNAWSPNFGALALGRFFYPSRDGGKWGFSDVGAQTFADLGIIGAQLSSFYPYTIQCRWLRDDNQILDAATPVQVPVKGAHKLAELLAWQKDFNSGSSGLYNMFEQFRGRNCQQYAKFIYNKLTGEELTTQVEMTGIAGRLALPLLSIILCMFCCICHTACCPVKCICDCATSCICCCCSWS